MNRRAVLDWPSGPHLFLHKYERISVPTCTSCLPIKNRCFLAPAGRLVSTSSVRRQDGETPPEQNDYQRQLGHRAREKLADKDFFFSLLSSASTKREAQSYLSRFKYQVPAPGKPKQQDANTNALGGVDANIVGLGANLGDAVSGVARATHNLPVLRQDSTPQISPLLEMNREPLHIALVKIREPQLLEDNTLKGVGRTLSQLAMLGMGCCVVLDPALPENDSSWRRRAIEQADRVSAAIDASDNGLDSQRLDDVIRLAPSNENAVSVLSRDQLLSPLRRGRIVVIPPIGYTEDTLTGVAVPADDVVLALTKEFTGLSVKPSQGDNPHELARKVSELQKEVSVDRLIVLDPAGGIPSLKRRTKAHVFVNLEQEYEEISEELKLGMATNEDTNDKRVGERQSVSSLAKSNPFSTLVEKEAVSLRSELGLASNRDTSQSPNLQRHLDNLKLLHGTLTYLPPSSSGIITTPQDAANSASPPRDPSELSSVGTRRQRNPLIHNLLTDKPSHSASLPAGRLGANNGSSSYNTTPVIHSTFFKKGMPLTLFPDPRIQIWEPPKNGESRMTLNDPCIDLPRLVQLIEDSFNRKLDVQHYLNRVNDHLAGLIIAGEYEGGAILTWELPPGVPNDGSEASRSRMVPYLDKFAVLKRSQGAGGVADIVFNAMVRTCLRKGVAWRSRRDNPVNKWYFERARGTWKLPGTNWTMFWTTDGVPENDRVFWDYEAVCRHIEPSWADNKHVAD
ncbi:amino-acid acetyltransferase, mitochondrial [Paracoccidioides brasiliensis Pb18]|uniref:Amino-acid acetyltransferase, mitochondrial n=1 Tax=Paracoccidioides brasiliensis (strain Pb18) TaxID=502780 RepID=C1G7Q2_PARBD|nr:amino-acid acetyltransferase, mitochondrial [Paracoccidioides brasiliensis Pb18]EEH47109.2 amino-acid acetyltransferase, mitochondrial [Paracoccidioides brasiliensis Pb18]